MKKYSLQINIIWLIVTIGLTVLKFTGQLAWSWWWTLSPIWLVFLLIGICAYIYFLKNKKGLL